MTVAIYRQTKGITTYRFLCDACQLKRIADGWTSERIREVPMACDDCAGEA